MSENNQSPANNTHLQRALAGEYKFNIKGLFSEAQSLYKQHLGMLLKATGLLMLIGVGCTMLLIQALGLDMTSVESMQSSNAGLLDIFMLIIMTPLIVGFRMLGVKLSTHTGTSVKEVTQYFPYVLVLVTANLLISLLTQIGLNFLILPGLYIYMATQFTVVLIAEKRLGLVQSVVLSVKVVNRYLFPFTLLLLAFVLMFLLILLTMGLAVLWVGPIYVLVMGRLYADLFGFAQTSQQLHSGGKDSILDA
ncbi:hypothetical protein [Alteromonas lipolytica]|uniref:Stress protein n=1 Tax=Alteromonas lipolytica TaxID=1856405 RepID=A0A1E8FH11_9ALTE|nr:hypothetical protein [Alteromonas lipolytica]OFI35232.1 hypothetical protein BFC17_16965 [Alteromonas lipolytica]GGF57792.1 hypothetical protein GCM10011338_07590 [Alteromonas lipolytica]